MIGLRSDEIGMVSSTSTTSSSNGMRSLQWIVGLQQTLCEELGMDLVPDNGSKAFLLPERYESVLSHLRCTGVAFHVSANTCLSDLKARHVIVSSEWEAAVTSAIGNLPEKDRVKEKRRADTTTTTRNCYYDTTVTTAATATTTASTATATSATTPTTTTATATTYYYLLLRTTDYYCYYYDDDYHYY